MKFSGFRFYFACTCCFSRSLGAHTAKNGNISRCLEYVGNKPLLHIKESVLTPFVQLLCEYRLWTERFPERLCCQGELQGGRMRPPSGSSGERQVLWTLSFRSDRLWRRRRGAETEFGENTRTQIKKADVEFHIFLFSFNDFSFSQQHSPAPSLWVHSRT